LRGARPEISPLGREPGYRQSRPGHSQVTVPPAGQPGSVAAACAA
jgi:hypothetical protein